MLLVCTDDTMQSLAVVVVALVAAQLSGGSVIGFPNHFFKARSEITFEFLPQLEDVLFRLIDSDKNGLINMQEIRIFLSSPGVPRVIQLALTRDKIDAADRNNNFQLERYEVQTILLKVVQSSDWSNRYLLQLVGLETQEMIGRGEISVPETAAEIARASLDILDTNRNRKLSEEEARRFYSVVADENVWRNVQRMGTAVDYDGDGELDEEELVLLSGQMQEHYGDMTMEPLLIYGRVMTLLGRIPTQ